MQQSAVSVATPPATTVKTPLPELSIIVPVFNEQQSLSPAYEQLVAVTAELTERCEFIFVDDGSHDESREVLRTIESADQRVSVIEFSRNFGKEIAMTAGLRAARGQAAIILDADLQHPVSLIPEFVAAWRGGAEVVIGVRKRYGNESPFKRLTSWLFYRLLNRISDTPVVPRATDYRLLDRVVIDAFNQFSERNRMTRGLIDWLGFRRAYIHFTSADRLYGTSTYGFKKLFGLAVNSFVGLSLFPLRLAGWLGVIITTFAGFAGLFMLVEDKVLDDPLHLNFSGPAILAVLNMFWIGIILIALGLVALYIANIHAEVINRPLYVVRPKSRDSHKHL